MAAAESSHVVAMGRYACILDDKRVLASNVKAARRVLEPSQEATAFENENDRTPGGRSTITAPLSLREPSLCNYDELWCISGGVRPLV